MSLQKFINAAKSNTAIQHDLAAASKESIIDVAKEHGFDLSVSDIDNAKKQRPPATYTCGDVLWTGACSL